MYLNSKAINQLRPNLFENKNFKKYGRSIKAPGTWKTPKKHFTESVTNPWYSLIFRILGQTVYTTNDYFRELNYVPTLMPITTGSISSPMGLGSDSLPVEVNLFGKPTYLADSMQFQLEYMLRQNKKGVFYIMPTFRGEDPDTRHLNQFYHSEAEIVGDLQDVMQIVGKYVYRLTSEILKEFGDELRNAGIGTEHLEEMLQRGDFIPTITYSEAKKILNNSPECFSKLPGDTETLSRLGEKELMSHFGGIVWVTHFPWMSVPFYQAKDKSGKYAKCADLLFGIGEVVGCGERHVGHDETLDALNLHEVDPKEYDWYLRMKREFPMKTSGFGLGVERFLLWVLKHEDIRDIPIMSRLKNIDYAP